MAATNQSARERNLAARERILQKIRGAQPPAQMPSPIGNDAIFPPIADPLARFIQECAANLTECIQTKSARESLEAIHKVIDDYPDGDIFVQDAPQLRVMMSALLPPGAGQAYWSSDTAIPEATQVSLTLAEALIAQTGSVLSSSACGGRGASAVPACHLVYATTGQIMPDLQSALVYALENGMNERSSYVGVITGSSRTADIEKILVQGAHGPRRLFIVLESR